MKNQLTTGIILMIFSCFRIASQTVPLSVHDTTFMQGAVVEIPVYVDEELNAYQVSAYRLQLEFDPNLMEVLGVNMDGTVSQALGEPHLNTIPKGKVTIGAAGTGFLSGKGIFIFIRFRILKTGWTEMNFTGVKNNYLNEGYPSISFNQGGINIIEPPSITLYAEKNSIAVGDSLQLWVWGGVEPYQWSVSDNSKALITEDRMLHALDAGFVNLYVEDGNGIKDSINNFIIRPFKISIPPQLTQWAGKSIDIPVAVTNLTASNVTSGSFKLQYDTSVLEWTEHLQHETLLENSTVFVNNHQSGLNIAFAGTVNLQGEGVLLLLRFNVKNTAEYGTNIQFRDVLFNEDIRVTESDGYFTVQQFSRLYIYPDEGELLAGDSIQLHIGSEHVNPVSWTVSNPSVASISETGMLKAIKGGKVKVQVTDSTGANGVTRDFYLIDTRIHIPDSIICVGELLIRYPVNILKIPDANPVLSLEMTLEFDTAQLQFNGLSYNNTVSNGWMHTSNQQQDKIRYATSGANAIASTGTLVCFDFLIKNPTPSPNHSIIHLQQIRMNEGVPVVNQETYGNLYYKDLPTAPDRIWGDTLIPAHANMAMLSITPLPDIYEYVWILPEGLTGTSNIHMIQLMVAENFKSGVISVYGVNECGDGARLEFTVNKETDTSLDEQFMPDIHCYPNPVKDKLHIRCESLNNMYDKAILYDITGKKVLVLTLTHTENELDVSVLNAGLYLLKIISGNQVKHISIIKE